MFLVCGYATPITSVRGQEETPTVTFSWREASYSTSIHRVWDNEIDIVNYSGTYTDFYTVEDNSFNLSEDTFTRAIRDITYDANYSYLLNTTLTGSLDVSLSLTVYRVNIDYGTGLKFIWIAIKEGTMEMELTIVSHIYSYTYYEEYNKTIDSDYEKYNLTTYELLDTWSDEDEIIDELNYTHTNNFTYSPYYQYQHDIAEFTMPLILTMQIFKTENQDRIAWANLFHDFLMYKDKDENIIYSVGDKGGAVNMWCSSEYCGYIRPRAMHLHQHIIYPEKAIDYSGYMHEPKDKTISELASTIVFTPPATTNGSDVSWGIEYPGYTIDASVMDDDIPVEEWWYTPFNATYAEASPMDFSYNFDYIVSDTEANLAMTWNLGKVSNSSFYDAVENYGLVMPHHSFFLASFDIDEVDMKELTVPCETFTFESNNTVVAKLNMESFNKKNYTIIDFPNFGEDTTLDSKGGSINPLVVSGNSMISHADHPFLNLMYSIEDIVKNIPGFTIADNLYHVGTQNYPVWHGDELVHDPDSTIYFGGYEAPPEPDEEPEVIFGFNLVLLLGVIGVVMITILLKQKKFKIK